MQRFTGKRVLITGSGRGIGAATARQFAIEGTKVYLRARSQAELLSTRDELRKCTTEVHSTAMDLTESGAAERLWPRSRRPGEVLMCLFRMQAPRRREAF